MTALLIDGITSRIEKPESEVTYTARDGNPRHNVGREIHLYPDSTHRDHNRREYLETAGYIWGLLIRVVTDETIESKSDKKMIATFGNAAHRLMKMFTRKYSVENAAEELEAANLLKEELAAWRLVRYSKLIKAIWSTK